MCHLKLNKCNKEANQNKSLRVRDYILPPFLSFCARAHHKTWESVISFWKHQSACQDTSSLDTTADRSSWCVQCWPASKLCVCIQSWTVFILYGGRVRVVLDWRPHTLIAYSVWPLKHTQHCSHTVSLPVGLSLKLTTETKRKKMPVKDANSRQSQTEASLSSFFLTITLPCTALPPSTFNLNWASKQNVEL